MKTPKIPWTKIKPQKSHAEFSKNAQKGLNDNKDKQQYKLNVYVCVQYSNNIEQEPSPSPKKSLLQLNNPKQILANIFLPQKIVNYKPPKIVCISHSLQGRWGEGGLT